MTDAIYDNIEITTTVHVEWKETWRPRDELGKLEVSLTPVVGRNGSQTD